MQKSLRKNNSNKNHSNQSSRKTQIICCHRSCCQHCCHECRFHYRYQTQFSRYILFVFFIVYHFRHVFNCVAASWMCGYQKYMFWSQFKSNPLSRMASVGQYQGKHYFLSDIHPLNSENWSYLSHLTYHATLAPSLSSFLSIIVVVLYHRRRSSPSLSDTRHLNSKQLGRGSNAKTSRNSVIFRTNGQMGGCTDTTRC